jgi:alcohol dehydrogenase
VRITTGLVDTYSTPTLSRLVATHRIDATRFAMHHFPLEGFMDAPEVFSTAAETGALQVVIERAPR